MYSITIFKPPRWWEEQQRLVYDNKTHRRLDFASWDKFTKFFYKLSERPLEGKTHAELISPAIFKPNSKRRNVNVLAWAGWAAIDIDDFHTTDVKSDVLDIFGDYRFICYSTASSVVDHPKFRIVLPLTKEVESADIRHFWFALQSNFNQMGDKQCKDLSRMYYVPGTYAGSYNFIFDNQRGRDVDVDFLLEKYPYQENKHGKNFLDRLPDEWKKQVLDYRQKSLDNVDYTWTSYQDCPFVDHKLVEQYKSIAGVDGTGRYRMIYKIMVAIAMNAVRKKYPIAAQQLVELILQLDAETTGRYQNRPLDVEANNAIEYAYKNTIIT